MATVMWFKLSILLKLNFYCKFVTLKLKNMFTEQLTNNVNLYTMCYFIFAVSNSSRQWGHRNLVYLLTTVLSQQNFRWTQWLHNPLSHLAHLTITKYGQFLSSEGDWHLHTQQGSLSSSLSSSPKSSLLLEKRFGFVWSDYYGWRLLV